MIRRLYDWVLAMAADRRAVPGLFAVSFAESSVFPIPPDLMLIPMVLAKRAKWLWFATVCTAGSVIGGIAGYFIGLFLFEQVAEPILALYGYSEKFGEFATRFNEFGPWIVFIAGITPFPYKVVTVASGATGLSFPVFVIASILSRGIRFFLVATLLYLFGPPIQRFIEKRLGLALTVVTIVGIAGFAAVRFL
ncbi:MAG: YqaA family protein [Pseudomonadota bacterium]